ncbi:MAG: hypothetical protein ACRD2U_01540 [Terriglobales bacterium]
MAKPPPERRKPENAELRAYSDHNLTLAESMLSSDPKPLMSEKKQKRPPKTYLKSKKKSKKGKPPSGA